MLMKVYLTSFVSSKLVTSEVSEISDDLSLGLCLRVFTHSLSLISVSTLLFPSLIHFSLLFIDVKVCMIV